MHPSASLRNAKLGRFTEIGERVSFQDSELGDYSYLERNAQAIYARIGKFSAIAANGSASSNLCATWRSPLRCRSYWEVPRSTRRRRD